MYKLLICRYPQKPAAVSALYRQPGGRQVLLTLFPGGRKIKERPANILPPCTLYRKEFDMKVSRLIALVLAAACIFTFTACGKETGEGAAEDYPVSAAGTVIDRKPRWW